MIRTHICPGGWPEMGCAERCPVYGSRQCVRLSQLTQVWVADRWVCALVSWSCPDKAPHTATAGTADGWRPEA